MLKKVMLVHGSTLNEGKTSNTISVFGARGLSSGTLLFIIKDYVYIIKLKWRNEKKYGSKKTKYDSRV